MKILVYVNLLTKRKVAAVLTKIFKGDKVKRMQTLDVPLSVDFVSLKSTFEDATVNIFKSKRKNIDSLFFGKVYCLLALSIYILSCSSPLIQLIDLAFKTVHHNRDS